MSREEFRNAAVLLDFENFYLAREMHFAQENADSPYHDDQLATDLRTLLRYCNEVSGHTLRVCRAYSDFTARRESLPARVEDGRVIPARYDYYLTRTPRTLIELGIEPIQVFRFSQSTGAARANKNAVDIRMAMDSSSFCRETPRYDLLIMVSGDSDFIPVVVDCRRHGTRVFGIGVSGSTNRNLEEFCDRFEYFNELEASLSLEDESNSDLMRVATALKTVLGEKPRLPAAAVRPELNKVLRQPFDPTAFGCRTTADFLREYRGPLSDEGIMVERGPNGSVLMLGKNSGTPNPANHGLDREVREETTPGGITVLPGGHKISGAGTNGHEAPRARITLPNYRQLLQIPPVRYYIYPRRVWVAAAELVLRATYESTVPPNYDDLVASAKDLGTDTDVPPLAVGACAYGICASRGLVPVESFSTFRKVDRYFHWKPSPEVEALELHEAAEHCFEHFIYHIAQELRQRLNQRPAWARDETDVEHFAALWAEEDPTSEDLVLSRRALGSTAALRR